MTYSTRLLLLAEIAICLPGLLAAQPTAMPGVYIYPDTRKIMQEDKYFGTVVKDPYRWLEDDRSPETSAWVREENSVTEAYLAKIPFRNTIKERMTQLWNFAKQTAPVKS